MLQGGQLKDALPERHRYASFVACNAHNASHIEGLMQTTILGGLGGRQHKPASHASNTATCCQKDDDFESQSPQGHQGVHPHLF